jgi:hypothetical protein
MCSKIDAAQQEEKFLQKQRFEFELVPGRNKKCRVRPEFSKQPSRISRQNARCAAENAVRFV